jgi:hypothetical protein
MRVAVVMGVVIKSAIPAVSLAKLTENQLPI